MSIGVAKPNISALTPRASLRKDRNRPDIEGLANATGKQQDDCPDASRRAIEKTFPEPVNIAGIAAETGLTALPSNVMVKYN
jgi:hypothetical protein